MTNIMEYNVDGVHNYRTVIYLTEVRSHFVLSVVNNAGKYGGVEKDGVPGFLGSEFNSAIISLLKYFKVNFSISLLSKYTVIMGLEITYIPYSLYIVCIH